MEFLKALKLLEQGKKVKRRHWKGYWRLEDGEIIVYSKGHGTNIRDCNILGIIDNILSVDWVLFKGTQKLFISQPMGGKTEEEILQTRNKALGVAREMLDEKVKLIDSYLDLPKGTKPLVYLAESLKLLAVADVAYFAKGWQNARGCKIEHECAEEYGITIIEEME